MKHDPEFVKALSRAAGISPRAVKKGLDDLVKAGHLAHAEHGYVAITKAKPPADQAEGSVISSSAPIGHPASQGSRDNE